jgi:hypothetical protein
MHTLSQLSNGNRALAVSCSCLTANPFLLAHGVVLRMTMEREKNVWQGMVARMSRYAIQIMGLILYT